MNRYHINPEGNPGKCSAASGNCPFGSDAPHYDTEQEARDAYEARHNPFINLLDIKKLSASQKSSLEAFANADKDFRFEYMDYVADEDEQDFFEKYTKKYNTPRHTAHTADIVLLAWHNDTWNLMAVRRKNYPYRGQLVTPGGFVDGNEVGAEAAVRELQEETQLQATTDQLIDVGYYDHEGRDPRMDTHTSAFAILANGYPAAIASDDAAAVEFIPLNEILSGRQTLGFDHRRILHDTLQKLKN
jgi:ADP-ribose pyrophosphatase YjhB (NUDIX family)